MKPWIVSGAGGFLGRRLLEALQEKDIQAIPYSLRNPQESTLPASAQVFVHLAARTGIATSWENSALTYEVNVLGTLKAIEIAKRTGAFFIFLSTAAYGAEAPRPTPETAPLTAVHPYGHSKAMAEDLIRFHVQTSQVKAAILRVFNVYGEGQSTDFLIPRLLAQVKDPNSSEIHLRNIDSARDFIFVDDVVNAITHLGQGQFEGTYNVATGKMTTIKELLEKIQNLSRQKKKIISKEESLPNEVKFSQADITRLRATGWSPKVSLDEGLQRLLKSTHKT